MQEKENILDILINTEQAIKDKDTFKLKKLSNRTVHTSSIFQDPDNIAIAVIVYSIGKILEREKYGEMKGWPFFYKTLIKNIDSAIDSLKQDDMEKFRESLKNIRASIENLSGHLRTYIQDVFRNAEINKASRIYEHGISLSQTASLLGISTFELAEYAGKTGIADVDLSVTKKIKDRIKISEDFFA